MKVKRAFKRTALVMAGLGAAGGLSAAIISCGALYSNISRVIGFNAYFVRDTQSRAIMADRAYKIDPTAYGTIVPDYSTQAIKPRYEAYLTSLGGNVYPRGDDAINFVSRIATAIADTNKENIFAWKDPSTTTLTQNEERYVVYLEGGPMGDACHQYVDDVNSKDSYARDFYVQQSQYGFVPGDYALLKGNSSATNTYFNDLKVDSPTRLEGFKYLFDQNQFTSFDYFRLIGGHAYYTDVEVSLLTSFVYAMITADRTAVLLESLQKQTSNIYLVGESYGMHAAIETLLLRPEALQFVKKAELGRNTLASVSTPYIIPEDKNGDGIDDSGAVYGKDIRLLNAVSQGFSSYGMIRRMTAALGSETGTPSDFLKAVREKITFGFSTDDKIIGSLPSADKTFYEKYGLSLELSTGGHGAFVTNGGYKKLTGAFSEDYSYAGLTTKTPANAGKGCLL